MLMNLLRSVNNFSQKYDKKKSKEDALSIGIEFLLA